MSTQNEYYDRFFSRGGWRYERGKERRFIEERIVPLAGWTPEDHVVELGAGIGLHSDILRELGFHVTAVEASSSGVAQARQRFPKLDVVHCDVSSWSPSRPIDHVFVRGMSYYHYELLKKNCHGVDVPAETKRIFDWLRPGGTFVLQIVTNFNGGRVSNGVHMNLLQDYVALFERFGTIVNATDWSGRALPWKQPRTQPKNTDRGIIIATQKS